MTDNASNGRNRGNIVTNPTIPHGSGIIPPSSISGTNIVPQATANPPNTNVVVAPPSKYSAHYQWAIMNSTIHPLPTNPRQKEIKRCLCYLFLFFIFVNGILFIINSDFFDNYLNNLQNEKDTKDNHIIEPKNNFIKKKVISPSIDITKNVRDQKISNKKKKVEMKTVKKPKKKLIINKTNDLLNKASPSNRLLFERFFFKNSYLITFIFFIIYLIVNKKLNKTKKSKYEEKIVINKDLYKKRRYLSNWKKSLVIKELELKAFKGNIEKENQEIKDKEDAIIQQKNILNLKKEDILSREYSKLLKKQNIRELKDTIEQKERNFDTKEKNTTSRKNSVQLKENNLSELEAHMEKEKKKIKERKEGLIERENAVDKKELDTTLLESSIKCKDNSLVELKNSMEERLRDYQDKNNDMVARELAIEAKEKETEETLKKILEESTRSSS